MAERCWNVEQAARLIYSLLRKGQEHTDQAQAYYEERYPQRVLHNLQRKPQRLGVSLVPVTPDSRSRRLENSACSNHLAEFLEGRHCGDHVPTRLI